MELIVGGNVCSVLNDDPIHALLYCNGCSAGYTIEAILNGSAINNPTSLIHTYCTQ